jgi:hypothetical protein
MKGKVALLIITVWLAVSVAAADAGSGHGQSAIAGSGTLITRDPLSGIYEEKAAADLNRKAFLEKMAGTYESFDGAAAPRLKRQMALFALDCRAMATHFARLAADERALAWDRTLAVAERARP